MSRKMSLSYRVFRWVKQHKIGYKFTSADIAKRVDFKDESSSAISAALTTLNREGVTEVIGYRGRLSVHKITDHAPIEVLLARGKHLAAKRQVKPKPAEPEQLGMAFLRHADPIPSPPPPVPLAPKVTTVSTYHGLWKRLHQIRCEMRALPIDGDLTEAERCVEAAMGHITNHLLGE